MRPVRHGLRLCIHGHRAWQRPPTPHPARASIRDENHPANSAYGSIGQTGREPNKTEAAHHMRTTLTATLAAAAAIPLAFLAAAPAAAAPGDISAVFTTTPNPGGSNTVTGTFTATGDNFPYTCTMYDNGAIDANDDYLLFANTFGDLTPSITLTDTDVPDGTYTINWYCFLSGGGYDGTTQPIGEDGYSAPSTLVVPAVVPEEPEPGCTGSVCLPTGSFGF